VLFSEPKIPQFEDRQPFLAVQQRRFSALQRAENSSIGQLDERRRERPDVSVLFSEPKIPQ